LGPKSLLSCRDFLVSKKGGRRGGTQKNEVLKGMSRKKGVGISVLYRGGGGGWGKFKENKTPFEIKEGTVGLHFRGGGRSKGPKRTTLKGGEGPNKASSDRRKRPLSSKGKV